MPLDARSLLEAAFWGALGASALLVGAAIAYWANPSIKVNAAVMAVGSGVLIGSVAFELIGDAIEVAPPAQLTVALLAGAGAFALGDWILDQRGGAQRKDASGEQANGSPLAIVLGSILDGIPESFVLGLTVLQGAISVPLLAGVIMSNLPEGMSSSAGLKAAHWPARRVFLMWIAVVALSAIAAAAGYIFFQTMSTSTGALVNCFAAGALLAMIADTMLPESYEVEGVLTGPLVTVGLAMSVFLETL
ncbi:MAG TPA: ZIP family zinc transporter [Acidimicrobiia bacterium]